MLVRQRDFLDPELRAPLEELLLAYPGGVCAIEDLEERRRVDADLAAESTVALTQNQTCTTEDVQIAVSAYVLPASARVYRPAGHASGGPAVMFIHGGGMHLGDLDYEHATAVRLCEELGVLVVSAGYRKAPEHPHPAAVEDCYQTLQWMASHQRELAFDPSRLAIWGGSAGGNLALATALMARDRQGPDVHFVVALYPMVDHRNITPSARAVTEVGVWDRATNIQAWDWYLAGARPDGYAAPLHMPELRDLPPVFIDVGDWDLFRDEDILLAQRLLAAGVPTELHVYPGVYHAAELYAPDAEISRYMWSVRLRAIRKALAIPEPT